MCNGFIGRYCWNDDDDEDDATMTMTVITMKMKAVMKVGSGIWRAEEECSGAFGACGGCGNYQTPSSQLGWWWWCMLMAVVNLSENRRPSSGAEEVMERIYDPQPSPDEILALQDELGIIAILQARREVWILKQLPEIVRRWKPSSMRIQTWFAILMQLMLYI